MVRYDVNQVRSESAMPGSARVETRIWWVTVSNTTVLLVVDNVFQGFREE